MRIIRTLLIISLFTLSIRVPADAAAPGTDFSAQCPILLAKAHQFANACLANAKLLKRYFNDEPEYHSAYLGSAAPGSHFALGCTLNDKKKIAFLGIYYTMIPNDFGAANSATVVGVDFTSNIAVVLNGRLANFLAVRAFQTPSIPLPYYSMGPINCEGNPLPAGEIEDNAGQHYYVTEWHVGRHLWVRDCNSTPQTCLPDAEYETVVTGREPTELLAPTVGGYLRYFIEAGGGFIVSQPELLEGCPNYYANPGKYLGASVDPIQQACFILRDSLKKLP